MMPEEYRWATGIVGSLGLAQIGANGVLLLAGSSASVNHRGRAAGGLVVLPVMRHRTGLLML